MNLCLSFAKKVFINQERKEIIYRLSFLPWMILLWLLLCVLQILINEMMSQRAQGNIDAQYQNQSNLTKLYDDVGFQWI